VSYRGERKKPYMASMVKTLDGVKKKYHLGSFYSEDEAFLAYKNEKQEYIKLLAYKYEDVLEPKVFHALLNYKVLEDF
jgi:hypothetical protein